MPVCVEETLARCDQQLPDGWSTNNSRCRIAHELIGRYVQWGWLLLGTDLDEVSGKSIEEGLKKDREESMALKPQEWKRCPSCDGANNIL